MKLKLNKRTLNNPISITLFDVQSAHFFGFMFHNVVQ